MTTTPMKERLARALDAESYEQFPAMVGREPDDWMDWLPYVDAILREMLKPSTTDAAMGKCPIHNAVSELAKGPEMLQDLDPEEIAQIRIWYIQHILNESQD